MPRVGTGVPSALDSAPDSGQLNSATFKGENKMSVDHETMRNEIDRLRQFIHARGDDLHLDHIAYALEDLPETTREQARMIMDVPVGGSFAKKVIEVTIDAAADLYGTPEKERGVPVRSPYPVARAAYTTDRPPSA